MNICVIHSFWSDHRDHSGIFRVIPEVTPKWVNNTNVHSKFTLISLFSKIHSLKSEHIHSFLFREYAYDWAKCCTQQHEQRRVGIHDLRHNHNQNMINVIIFLHTSAIGKLAANFSLSIHNPGRGHNIKTSKLSQKMYFQKEFW